MTTKCEDAELVIDNWDPETFTVTRNTPTYSAGMPTDDWSEVETFEGDWQPASARTERDEEGLEVRSQAFIIGPCNLSVTEDDRITRTNGEVWYVNYVKLYAGHTTIMLKATGGQQ